MNKAIKYILAASVLFSSLGISSCTTEQAANSAAGIINSINTSNSDEVMSVKTAFLSEYSTDRTVGQALDDFLSNERWQYFRSESGDKIVECTGQCSYNNENVEAKIQFKLNDNGTFEVSALGLNDMSQNWLMINSFLGAVFDGDDAQIPGGTTVSDGSKDKAAGSTKSPSSNGFVFETDEYLLDSVGLEDGTTSQLGQRETRILLNEIYAYHGYTFSSEEFSNYFSKKSWYAPVGKTMAECEMEFNDCEKSNKDILVNLEQRNGWR